MGRTRNSKEVALALLIWTICFCARGQDISALLDYTVSYSIPNKKKQANDTINLSFNKAGTLYYTKNQKLAKVFASEIFKGENSALAQNSEMQVLFDIPNEVVTLGFDSEKINLLMTFDINIFLPKPTGDTFNLQTNKVEASSPYSIYELRGSADDQNPMLIELDELKEFQGQGIFDFLLSKMAGGVITNPLPNGIPVKGSTSGGKVFFKLINISEEPSKITIQNNFKLE